MSVSFLWVEFRRCSRIIIKNIEISCLCVHASLFKLKSTGYCLLTSSRLEQARYEYVPREKLNSSPAKKNHRKERRQVGSFFRSGWKSCLLRNATCWVSTCSCIFFILTRSETASLNTILLTFSPLLACMY